MFSFGLIEKNYMIRDPSLPLKSAHPIEAGRPQLTGNLLGGHSEGRLPTLHPLTIAPDPDKHHGLSLRASLSLVGRFLG